MSRQRMTALMLVGVGGGLGAIARYLLSGWVLHHTPPNQHFPWGTFAVNVSGCLIAGVVSGLIAKHELFSPDMRLFLITGILGGFTTFSAFGIETVTLIKRGEIAIAAAYVASSVVAGIGGLAAAWWLAAKR